MDTTTFDIINEGPEISRTDFWETDHARAGLLYLSWNAGCARLLVPAATASILNEFETGEYVIVSRGWSSEKSDRQAIEIMIEDHSPTPYAVIFDLQNCDRVVPSTSSGNRIRFDVYTENGKALSLLGRYRVVPEVPYRRSWNEERAIQGQRLDQVLIVQPGESAES